MLCSNCGVQNDDNLNYCTNCGAPLSQGSPAAPQQPVYQQPVAPQPVYQVAPVIPGKGMGIAGMVLGIVGLVFVCFFYIGLPCSIIGLILSVLSFNKAKAVGQQNSMATAGIVCSCISLGINVISLILAVIGIASVGSLS